jgi:hypothetical protein
MGREAVSRRWVGHALTVVGAMMQVAWSERCMPWVRPRLLGLNRLLIGGLPVTTPPLQRFCPYNYSYRRCSLFVRPLVALLVVLCLPCFAAMSQASGMASAASVPAVNCGNLTLTMHPGLPTSMRRFPVTIAPDIPRRRFSLRVPLYPGAQTLPKSVGTPVPEFPESSYLQTAVVEYGSSDDLQAVMNWYANAFRRCGWMPAGTGAGGSDVLQYFMTFYSRTNHNLQMELSFGGTASYRSVVAYAAEWITLPKRPAASYLHGPFTQVRIAYPIDRTGNIFDDPPSTVAVEHMVIHDRGDIKRLVTAINSLTDIYQPRFPGASVITAPNRLDVRLSFIRANGSVVHAWTAGDGGPLVVNGARPLADAGNRQAARVWPVIEDLLPQVFALRQGDLGAWTFEKVIASHEEGSLHAWEESRFPPLKFYRGSWRSLDRSGGWFERALLKKGSTTATVTVLTSVLPSSQQVQTLYARVMKPWQCCVPQRPLPYGNGSEIYLGALVGSPGGATNVETVDYLEDGRAFIEIHTDELSPGPTTQGDVVVPIARVLGTRGLH